MKKKKFLLAMCCAAAACLFVSEGAHGQISQVGMVSGMELRQNATNDNGTATTVKAPERFGVGSAALLEDLAVDETINGSWFNTNGSVPRNAKLMATFAGPGDFSSLSFKVVSGANEVDVSNLLTAAPAGSNTVIAGTHLDANGPNVPPFSARTYELYTITYDATGIGQTFHFSVTGLATVSTVTTKPNPKTQIYTETDSFSLANGTGSGIDGTAFVLTGVTVTSTGTAKLKLQPGAGAAGNSGNSEGFSDGDGVIDVSAPPPSVDWIQLN